MCFKTIEFTFELPKSVQHSNKNSLYPYFLIRLFNDFRSMFRTRLNRTLTTRSVCWTFLIPLLPQVQLKSSRNLAHINNGRNTDNCPSMSHERLSKTSFCLSRPKHLSKIVLDSHYSSLQSPGSGLPSLYVTLSLLRQSWNSSLDVYSRWTQN